MEIDLKEQGVLVVSEKVSRGVVIYKVPRGGNEVDQHSHHVRAWEVAIRGALHPFWVKSDIYAPRHLLIGCERYLVPRVEDQLQIVLYSC